MKTILISALILISCQTFAQDEYRERFGDSEEMSEAQAYVQRAVVDDSDDEQEAQIYQVQAFNMDQRYNTYNNTRGTRNWGRGAQSASGLNNPYEAQIRANAENGNWTDCQPHMYGQQQLPGMVPARAPGFFINRKYEAGPGQGAPKCRRKPQ